MDRIVYVNGDYLPEAEAKVSVFDRGFLFADGVYEVSSVLEGKLVDNEAHLARLERSLGELKIEPPCSNAEIEQVQHEIISRNGLREGTVYLQVTRGAADRDFSYPQGARPSFVVFCQTKNILADPLAESGISIITLPEIRWQRRDIKTVGLLPASMAKQAALDAGVKDAWMIEDGHITEGTSNNAYIVTDDRKIITRALSNAILHGITRRAVLRLAEQTDYEVEERAFTAEEAYQAREAFLTSASTFVLPVVEIDGHAIGDGRPGPAVRELRRLYIEMALNGG